MSCLSTKIKTELGIFGIYSRHTILVSYSTMEMDPRHEHVPLLKPPDIYETFGIDGKTQPDAMRREAVVAGLHHIMLKSRDVRRFPLIYTLDVLQQGTHMNKPPHDSDVLNAFNRSSEAFYIMQRTERQFERSIRDALTHQSRPEGTLSSLQMASIFNLGTSTMNLIISNGELEAENIADSPGNTQWAIGEESLRDFYAWHRPEGYPEYPDPLQPIR